MLGSIGEYVSLVFFVDWEDKHRTGRITCEMVDRLVKVRVR